MGNLIQINSSCHWVESSFDKYMAAQPSYDRSVSLELGRRKWVMPRVRRPSLSEWGRMSSEKQSCLQKAYSWKGNTKNCWWRHDRAQTFQGATLGVLRKGLLHTTTTLNTRKKYQLNNLSKSQHWDWILRRGERKTSQDTRRCRTYWRVTIKTLEGCKAKKTSAKGKDRKSVV